MSATTADLVALNSVVWRLVEGFRQGFSEVIDPVRYGVLRTVIEAGPLRPTEIARALGVLASSVTRHIQALQGQGLVATLPNPVDQRSVLVEATESGRAWLAGFESAGAEATSAVLAGWTRRDVRELTTLMTRLVEDWQAQGAAHRRPGDLGPRTDQR